MKPIAVAVYLNDSGDLYSKNLYTEEEVEAVRQSEDEDTQEWKTIIVHADMSSEDHT